MYDINLVSIYNPGDKFIKLQDSKGQETITLNSCRYEQGRVVDNKVLISLTDCPDISLDFPNKFIAIQALEILQTSFEALQPNCLLIPTPGSTPLAQSITLDQYKILQSTSSLVSFQWYDVSDLSNIFGLGPVLRVQAININDYQPSGILPTNNARIQIDVLNDVILKYQQGDILLESTEGSSFTLNNSVNIRLKNSNVILDNSNEITSTDSFLNLTNSNNVIVNNSNITGQNINNSYFEGISVNLNSFPAGFSDINVNQHSTIGKLGVENLGIVSKTLQSYSNYTNQIVDLSLLNSNIDITLNNLFLQSNAVFKFFIRNTGGYNINVRNSVGSLLKTINENEENLQLNFIFNKGTQLFEYNEIENVIIFPGTENIAELTVAVNNQSFFTLPFEPSIPERCKLYVNGILMIYGLTKDFTISGVGLTWNNRNFSLETSDELILYLE